MRHMLYARKRALGNTLTVLMVTVCVLLGTVSHALAVTSVNVYRFYNSASRSHFYTASRTECMNTTLLSAYHYDGIAWTLNSDSPWANKPLHRFYNFKIGTHFYTASEAEKDNIIANLSGTYRYEYVAYNVSLTPGTGAPVYRFYNKTNGSHFYTASATEANNLIANYAATYSYDGVAYFVPTATAGFSPIDWVNYYAPGGWKYQAPATPVYNCMAYALGITDTRVWPTSSPVCSETEMDALMLAFNRRQVSKSEGPTIVAYGYPGDIRHVAKVTSSYKTVAKHGSLERYEHPSWTPYLDDYYDIYAYGRAMRYYK